ncbi:hypothetical protein BV22DRAFT_760338 [Leucogyrophana mollusca]|uniref:Uncharacterized protein n=1 Tax=Leucogyrophana mollusca TaxID=85980 RepID=A0ACB8B5R3_9AGAM|nr:hypothetical protein BV22DRAFT_760338 [Leucogyrophana mollusca]
MLDKCSGIGTQDSFVCHHSVLRRVLWFAFDDENKKPIDLLFVNHIFYNLAYPAFLSSLTFWTERSFLDAMSRFGGAAGRPCSADTHLVKTITICFLPSSLRLSVELLEHFSKPVLFPNLHVVRFAFAFGAPLVPGLPGSVLCGRIAKNAIENADWLNPCSLSFGYLHMLNPKRFEWASSLPSSSGAGVVAQRSRFCMIGVHSNLRRLFCSWTNLDSIYLDGVCLLHMDNFSTCRVFLPVACVHVRLPEDQVSSNTETDTIVKFLAVPGCIVGSNECQTLLLERSWLKNNPEASDTPVRVASLFAGGTILSLQGFTHLQRTRFRNTFFGKVSKRPVDRIEAYATWLYLWIARHFSMFLAFLTLRLGFSSRQLCTSVFPALSTFVFQFGFDARRSWSTSIPALVYKLRRMPSRLFKGTHWMPRASLRYFAGQSLPTPPILVRFYGLLILHILATVHALAAVPSSWTAPVPLSHYLHLQQRITIVLKAAVLPSLAVIKAHRRTIFFIFLIETWLFVILPPDIAPCVFRCIPSASRMVLSDMSRPWAALESSPTSSTQIPSRIIALPSVPIRMRLAPGSQCISVHCHQDGILLPHMTGFVLPDTVHLDFMKAMYNESAPMAKARAHPSDYIDQDEDDFVPRRKRAVTMMRQLFPGCATNGTRPCSLDQCAVRVRRGSQVDAWGNFSVSLTSYPMARRLLPNMVLSAKLTMRGMKNRVDRAVKHFRLATWKSQHPVPLKIAASSAPRLIIPSMREDASSFES